MRILFITSTRIGDAILSTGALAHLIDRHPAARITVACGPAAAPLFSHVPNLDRLILIEKARRSMHWLRLWTQCIGHAWSVIVDLRRSVIPFSVLARRRFVLARAQPDLHKVRQVADMIGLDEPAAPRIWTGGNDQMAAEKAIPDGGPVLALGPTANWGGKRWPATRFAGLIENLTGPRGILPGARVAVFSAPEERGDALEVLNAVPADRRIDLAGRTSLTEAHAALARCALYIGNDSGLMHLAAAAGTPTLGLFGPSRETRYAPWGPNCAWVRTDQSYDEILATPGYEYRSQETRMDSLSVNKVVAAAQALWARVSP